MSDKNRDRLIEGILYYKEAIKNSGDKEYIERCQKKIDNDEIKRRITMDYEGRIDNWN